MDEDERKRKLEAGKAKLDRYRKKKHSKKKKHGTPSSTPRDASNSEELEPCDSTAVETGDDSSLLALTPSDDSERSSTTAEDISTEEETGYSYQLSPTERLQELELTVSDQQAALQKLTLENKALREKSTAMAEKAIMERDSVINELRDSVAQSAQHVRHLQQQLTQTTSAIINNGGQQNQMEDKNTVYDREDARAYREQAELLKAQLETAYRDIEKLKRDHDKEIISLNQQLVNTVDEYETKLQDEKVTSEDLEQRLDMADTVSSEIQVSFSKQLQQLEEERDLLRKQLRQSQTQMKENSTSKTKITSLEDEVLSYQTELAEVSQRFEEAEKQKRQFRDDMERAQEALLMMKNEKSELETSNNELMEKITEQTAMCEDLKAKIEDLNKTQDDTYTIHDHEISEFQKQIAELLRSGEEEKEKMNEKINVLNIEHSEELKNLHSQHHRQMDELKEEMEKELEATRCGLNEVRKEELETVKDVHERSHDREFSRMQENHEAAIREMKKNHAQEIEAVKTEAQEVKQIAEERMRIELKEEFDGVLENELASLRRSLEREFELAETEAVEKHRDEILQLKATHEDEINECLKSELEKQKSEYEEQLAEQKTQLDKAVEKMKSEFDQAEEMMANDHAESLAKMESEMELIHESEEKRSSNSNEVIQNLEAALQEKTEQNDSLTKKIVNLDEKLKTQISHMEEQLKGTLNSQQAAIFEEKKMLEEKCLEYESELDELKEELLTVQTERDDIFTQAEESQKRLAAMHHEDSNRMQEEYDQLQADYQEKVEQMQYEIESLRASRVDLQDLRKQLVARNESVDEMTRIHEEFAEEKQKLLQEIKDHEAKRENIEKEYEDHMDKLKQDHHNAMEKEHERITQLLQDLEEHKEKMDEMTSSGTPLESSPLRSISQMSDYDSTNVAALNKDYRSAMTLTHVSGVSGLSETLEPAVVEEENSELLQQIETLKQQLEESEAEVERLRQDHEDLLSQLRQEHEEKILEINEINNKKSIAMEEIHNNELTKAEESLQTKLNDMKEMHQKEIMQIHMQCAADTAKQIEEETTSIREEITNEFGAKAESLKHQLELESSEKLALERQKHQEELVQQSKELSQSMEVRIAAVMGEMHEQKQETLQKASCDHENELARLREELNLQLKEASEKQEALSLAWKEKEQGLEKMIENLKSEMESAKEDYKTLVNGLDSGSSEYLSTLQAKHEDEIEQQRVRLAYQYEERQEKALRKQAETYEQAQTEFMKLHKEQFDKFVMGQRKDSEVRDLEIVRRIQDVRKQVIAERDVKKEELIATHTEEMKVVATKLVQVEAKKEAVEKLKDDLLDQLEEMKSEHQQEILELKSALVNQHMAKFQEVTVNLDQLHKEEMEGVRMQHHEKISSLRAEIDSYQEKLDQLEAALRKEKDQVESMISSEELELKLKAQSEMHDEELKRIQEEHDTQLQQIDEEIAKQASQHQESLQKIMSSQTSELGDIQQQFNEAVSKAVETGKAENQKLQERITELEAELVGMDHLRTELNEAQSRKEEASSILEEWKLKIQAWEEERNEEREAYEKKLSKLSESLENMREEHKDLNARIEFERVEYETELESALDEVRTKEENIKELTAEIEHKNAALESLVRQQEQLSDMREREKTEGDNLANILRDDLERINKERDAIHTSNEQLLSVLSDLVRSNHKCEEIIAKRLEKLPIMSNDNSQQGQAAVADGTDSESSQSPPTTSLSGSFVDEGLDLSQRFSESLFAGPELDSSARDVITAAGTRVGQATERLLDMLDSTIRKLNASQQAQTLLSNELERMLASKQQDKPENDDVTSYQEAIRSQTSLISELEAQVADLQQQLLSAVSQQNENLAAKEQEIVRQYAKLEEEKALLQKQKKAMAEGRDSSELNLLQTTEELGREKFLLIEQHQQERDRLAETARDLEEAVEEEAKAHQEKEDEYLSQIDDLNSQLSCLKKQTESRSRFTAELTEDRELERDQFEKAMEEMRNEIDQVRDAARSDVLLAEKVAHLEEELDAKQKTEEENVAEIEKLKGSLEEKDTLITDLQEHVKSQQAHDTSSDQTDLQVQLEESKRQEEVLQKELYDNMLRISALEAQLDRYRHGLDEDAIAALEKSEAEERKLKELAIQDLEAREQEVEVLVEQQNSLRKQIIEKEEEVERLLQEMDQLDDLKAENIELKENVKSLEAQVNEQPISQSDQMGTLSQQLLDDKNAEIDDLRRQMSLLQSDEKDASYQQSLSSLQSQLQELEIENQRLSEELERMLERVERHQSSQLPEDVAVVEEVVQKTSASQEDTGIQDLSVTDLTRPEVVPVSTPKVKHPPVNLERILEENNSLHQQLQEAKSEAADLLLQMEQENVLKMSPEIKEKIRDVEELLEKYDVSSEEPQKENFELDALNEKLNEIAHDLVSLPLNVLGRIINSKQNAICEKDLLIEELQQQLAEKQDLPEVTNKSFDDVNESQDTSSASDDDEESTDSSDSEKEDENADASLNQEFLQLKNLLSEKEDEILKREATVTKQQDLLNEKDNRLAELAHEEETLHKKLSEISNQLNQRITDLEEAKSVEENLTQEISSLQETIAKLQQDSTQKSTKVDSAAEEISRLSDQLNDVQKECASLLGDNQKLDREKCAMENELSEKNVALEELEDKLVEIDERKEKNGKKEMILMEKIQSLNEELQEIKMKLAESEKTKQAIKIEYEKLCAQEDQQIDGHTQPGQIVHAGGDTAPQKASVLLPQAADDEQSMETERLLHENETLKEEVGNLTFKTEELLIELDLLKESHVTKQESPIGQSNGDVSQLQHMYESTRIEPPQTRKSSITSSSGSESENEDIEELKKEYQRKIEEIKNDFAQKVEEAVAIATQEKENLNQRKLSELEEKHRQEITELLSESGIGDNELAQRLRNELDLADKLDHQLINQLTSATQKSSQLVDSESDSMSSPEKEAEISSRLQHLLSRLHNEGVQVLSLSELQFLKQHQPHKNVSMNTDPQDSAPSPNLDIEGLRRAWENEKLALLDAIQALKELLTQTATDSAQLTDDDENLKWRGELLRSVADLFEREKHALLAELRACVIEAHGECEDPSATSRLESLERKLRSQQAHSYQNSCFQVLDLAFTSELLRLRHEMRRLTSLVTCSSLREMQRRSELERLLAADRDQLVNDVKQLKAERKEKLEQANARIEQLQELNRVAEDSGKIAAKHLQNDVECLKGKLEQEQALTSDLRTSLQFEKQRSNDLLPALEKERQRTLDLTTELASLGEHSGQEMKQIQNENKTLRLKVDGLTQTLAECDAKLENLQKECDARQDALIAAKQQQNQIRGKDQETIANLRNTLGREESIRTDVEKALQNEKNRANQLRLDVTSERGKMYEEVSQWKNRCDDLTSAIQAERGRCEELQSALERETASVRHARLEMDNERKTTSKTRDHERATISDLQAILENAKLESEKVQQRAEIAEQDRDLAIRKAGQERSLLERRLEQEKASREEVMDRERVARIELQTALDTEKLRKEDLKKRIHDLEKHYKDVLKNQELAPGKSPDTLLASRRQLESLRQRLQLEASKFENLVNRASNKPSPRLHYDSVSPTSSLLSTDGEKFESLKRSLQDMQDELKDLYAELSLPHRASESRSVRPVDFNDRLLQQNAELAQFAADAAKETRELRDAVDALHHQQRRPRVDDEVEPQTSTDHNQQKMGNRIHKLYTRYLRAESFRKSLIYQKKYLLLLLGGFQDCEEATLAMIARMGAYPSDDALRRTVTTRSEAFTRFRSAARVVIAVCRLKFLVRKWKRASNTVSTAIQNKHGVAVGASATVNGDSHNHDPSPSPSPGLDYHGDDYRHSNGRHQPLTPYSPHHRYSNEPPSRDTSPFTSTSHVRASVSPYSPHLSSSHGHSLDHPYTDDYRRYSPTPTNSYSAMDRSNQADTDPSLNDYIQKLENIQSKLRYPR